MGGAVGFRGGESGVVSIEGIVIAWLEGGGYTVSGLKDTWSMLQWWCHEVSSRIWNRAAPRMSKASSGMWKYRKHSRRRLAMFLRLPKS